MTQNTHPLAEIENLRITFRTDEGPVEAVRGVSLQLGREKLGIVGESGSGKSLTGRALMGVLPAHAQITADRLSFAGMDLLHASPRQRRALRGGRMGMILQDPKHALNPVMRVGTQIIEALRIGEPRLSRRAAKDRALKILNEVQIRDPERVLRLYPHELSGGMGQRVMIAMMVVRAPELLVADEPTSALDVTVRDQVIDILSKEVTSRGMGLILISHDLRMVSRVCDRILIMYAGQILETLEARNLAAAQHPYTQGLLACLPEVDHPVSRLPVLSRDPSWKDARP